MTGGTPIALLLAAVGGALAHAYHLRSVLPERVASHFNAAGHPNGWMARDGFVIFYVGMVLLLAFVFLLVSLIIGRVPPELVNLPNKNYWLAPERRAETAAWMRGWGCLMGTATVSLMIYVMRLVEHANLEHTSLNSSIVPALLLFGGVSIALVIALFVHFQSADS
jgi:hypothetical protein